MHRSLILRAACALLAAGLSAAPALVNASGDDGYSESIFSPEHHVPPAELADYAAGKLGVVTPSYWRIYHFLAWRALSGRPLSKDEMALLNVRSYRVGPDFGGSGYAYDEEANGVQAWTKARTAVKGASEVKLGVEADIGNFDSIINCPADAFKRASQTLNQRLTQGGQQWAAVWLSNQDAVFANCSPELDQEARQQKPLIRPLVLPAALPAKAPVWLQKDHAYQRAAAHFYAGRYIDARTQFLAISNDAASPWQPLGKYLAARSLIRSVSAQPGERDDNAKRTYANQLTKARAELSALAPSYAPAQQLVDWIDVRIRPEERRRELSATLSTDPITAGSVQKLVDYLMLMDGIEQKLTEADDPMTAWIGAMQSGRVDRIDDGDTTDAFADSRAKGRAVARAQWEKKPDTAWLLAILANSKAADLKPAERKAAAAVKADSPAYVALQYHLAQIALSEGRTKEADAIATTVLKMKLQTSTRNRFLRVKMVSAPTADAALAAAARVPVASDDDVPIPNEGKSAPAAQVFDTDLRSHVTRHLPLATLVKLKPALPAEEQRLAAELAWTRAVLLGQYAIADAVTDDLARSRATTRHLYERYKKAATPDAKRDAAILILANTPELAPHVSRGKYGNYWICMGNERGDDGLDAVSPAFVSADERAQVEKEKAELRTLLRRSSYLIPRVIEWAKLNKTDPEAPKALHFLIASTRNECGEGAEDNSGRKYSKEAFEFLHRNYPKNEWTARTKYYY